MDKAPLLSLAILLLQVPCRAGDWSVLSGSVSGVKQARAIVVRTPTEWKRLWTEHAAGKTAPLPEVDFSKESVVAVFAGERRSGGYRIAVEVLEDPRTDAVTVLYDVRDPAPGGMTISMMTQPFLFRKIAKPAGPVLVKKAEDAAGKLVKPERRAAFEGFRAGVAGMQELGSGVFAGL
ncbi:MAG: protease complex subunit PrcB family protein [Elusimicrobiota bacterium]